jgi:enoyl-CoA hydratase
MNDKRVVTWQKKEHIAYVSLDREDRRNAMGMAFWTDLPAVFEEIEDDEDVRAVILGANGPDFTVGLDLTEMGEVFVRASQGITGKKYLLEKIDEMQAAVTAVEQCKAPVIAVVHGWCIGGGVDLITACDMRIATSDATITVRETKIAIVADLGTLQRLQKVIPRGYAAELVYTGKDVGAEHAANMGLFNYVEDSLEAAKRRADALATEIAENSPLAVQGAKSVMRYSADRTIQEGLDYVALWNTSFLQSKDLTEAIQAFMEKREPEFTGE